MLILLLTLLHLLAILLHPFAARPVALLLLHAFVRATLDLSTTFDLALTLHLDLGLGLLALLPTLGSFGTFRALGAFGACGALRTLGAAIGLVRLRRAARLAIFIALLG